MIESLAAAAALLLTASGFAKLGHPDGAAVLVRRLVVLVRGSAPGRSWARATVRLGGAGEVAVGVAVLVTGSRAAVALLAVAYLSFTAVAVLLIRAGDARTSCGCFGSTDSPLGLPHLVLDVLASAAALVAAVRPPGPALGLWDGSASTAAIGSAQAVLLAALGYLAVTSLPALLAARRVLDPTGSASVPSSSLSRESA